MKTSLTQDSTLQEYLPRRGEDFYYVSLRDHGLSPEKQHALQVIHSTWQWIVHQAEYAKTPEIASQKLAWCRTEIDRLYRSLNESDTVFSSHPLFEALHGLVTRSHHRHSQWAACIEATQTTLSTHIFETQASLNQHFQHLGGIRLSLLAQTLLENHLHLSHEKILHQVGIGLEIIRHLQMLPHHLAHQKLYLPLEVFPEPQEENAFAWLQTPVMTPDIEPLIQQQLDLAHDCLSQMEELSMAELTGVYHPLYREVLLKRALLRTMKKKCARLLDAQHPLRLSPLRKLWIVL